jgi:hypothetical protein
VKPLPEAVQAAFPCEAGNLRERPWWYKSRHGVGGADCLRRTDDPHTTAFTVEQAAVHDAANPLPHPGFRAGQVWVGERGQSVIFLSVAHDTGWVAHHVQGIRPVLLDSLAHMYPYLMADPACPHLAPWSPAEVKP